MKKLISDARWLVLMSLLLLLIGAQTQAQTTPAAAPGRYSLEGQWKGALTVPGGSLPLTITVTELADGNRFAVLDVPMQRVNREPMTVTPRGDTLTFEAGRVGCRFVGRRSGDGLQLLGVWQQPGYSTPLTLLFVPPATPAAAKAFKFPPPYRVEEVMVPNPTDHLQLAGTLTVPPGEGPFPAVVLLSDQDSQTREAQYGDFALFGSLADYLTRRGVAVLRLDDRGTGKSGGDSATATVAARTRDAQAALGFLRTRPLIDVAHLGLIGHGQGGNVALLAAAQALPPNFVATLAAGGLPGTEVLAEQQPSLLLRAGAPDTALLSLARRQEQSRQQARQQADKLRASGSNAAQVATFLEQQRLRQKVEDKKRTEAQRKRRRSMLDIIANSSNPTQAQAIVANVVRQDVPGLPDAAVQAAVAHLTSPWYRDYVRFDPRTELSKTQGSVLLLHGTADEMVAPANLEPLSKGLKGHARVLVQKIEGANHLFQAPTTEWPLLNGQPQPVISSVALEELHGWIMDVVKE